MAQGGGDFIKGEWAQRRRRASAARAGTALLTALFAILWTALLGLAGQAALAQKAQTNKPPYVLLRADEVTYDQKAGLLTATGSVEIAHDKEILRAQKITYNEKKDTVTADGNVVMLEPTGEVYFAEHAEFTDNMKDAVVKSFRMLLKDNSRLAAAGGTRTGGVVLTLNKAVFSPCDLCKDNPDAPPLWRIRAVRVIHDTVKKDVEYKDAWLEMYGIPIFYTPYLSHPDPSVKRRTGLLAPSYGTNTDMGLFLSTPYFWNIAPNEDATITPYFLSDEADVLRADYRRRFTNGQIEVDGSITQPQRRDSNGNRVAGTDTRGHLFANGEFDHNNIWRTRFQIERASDDTYLRRYRMPLPNDQTLTSSFTTEGFSGRNYAQISGYAFQGLRATDDPGQSPLVLPYGSYHYSSQPFSDGSFITADSSILVITRGEGTDSRRLSLNTKWELPYVASTGEIYHLAASLQTDAYSANDVVTASGAKKSGFTGRIFPQIMAEWRLPLARSDKTATQVVEPRAAVIVAPNGGNPNLIPNEDSSNVEFDTTNLFSMNRFTGTDRVEDGTRFIYGVNWGIYGHRGGSVETFLGQSYRLHKQADFGASSGLSKQLSDVVGKIRVSPGSWLDLLYRFRYDAKNFAPRRNEANISIGPSTFKLNTNYLYLNEDNGTDHFGDREELVLGFWSRINRFWSASGHIRENLADNGGPIDQALSVAYQDECFTFRIQGTRTFTQDRDLRPTDTLMFQLIFKHLGEISSSG